MPIFTMHEEENATILEAAFGDQSDPTNYNYNYNRKGASKVEKTQQEEALENVQKSFSELSQLLALTGLLQKQEHVVMSNCLRAPGLEAIGQTLPATQLISLRKQDYKKVAAIIADGVQTAKTIVWKRQQTCEHLLMLKRYWRLAVYTDQSMPKRASAAALTGRDTLAIDCSFCASLPALLASSSSSSSSLSSSSSSAAAAAAAVSKKTIPAAAAKPSSLSIALGKMRPCLVPLLFGPDGAPLPPAAEQMRPVDSLCLRLVHAPTGQTLVAASLWDLAAVHGAMPGPGGALAAVHAVCQRRQHESMCQLLFSCIKSDAAALSTCSDGSCRWIIAPPIAPPSGDADTVCAESEAAHIFAAEAACVTRTLDIAAISRAQVLLLVSDNLQLLIELQTRDGSGGGAARTYSRHAKALARAMLGAQALLVAQIDQKLYVDNSVAEAAAAPSAAGAESFLSLLLDGARVAVVGGK